MPIYLYKCEKCQNTFDVVKSMSDIDRVELCECGHTAERKINFQGELLGTAVEEAEYNPGLGCWTRNKRHRQEIAKRRGLVEIGNDEKPDSGYKRFQREREIRHKRGWDKLTKEITHGV